MCDGNPIVIKCQLNRTDLSVNYVKSLRIYFTNLRDNEDIIHVLKPGDRIYKSEFHSETVGNVTHYTFNITVNPRLNRSIITCGAGYPYQYQVGNKYCYTASAALITLRDNIPCDTTTTETPVTPESTTTPKVNSVEIISMNKEEFFPVVGIVVLVGVALLVANVIQLWVIVRNRRTITRTTVDNVSAMNGIALELGTDMEYDVDSKTHGDESEDDSNSTTTGSG